ncbi:MAG: TlpA family protein disulfide reductase [Nitrospirota bacterium]|nr:TlpA family protein disulfide reductase [Nitrospirota bacterium]MDH5574832.1 TlpA family protein disulfide reductase [Nitrospirota bacterium]
MTFLFLIVWLALSSAIAWAEAPSVPLTIGHADNGTSLPAFRLNTLQGLSIESKALAGRVLILNFWASWCGPCKEEMPSLERLRQKFSPGQLQILAVTTENRPQEIQAFWQQLELRFDVLLDEQEELSQALMVRNLPTTVIVDAYGNLTGRVMGPREWDNTETVSFIRSLMK